MATNGPWYTSTDLIEAIKRKIAFPISQNTFSEEDILAFANEEMLIAQVPSILKYHEEYFVTTVTVPLQANKSKYEIPNRAIGMKLRDVFYQDEQGNLSEMTRISSDDSAYFQANIGSNTSIGKFYLQGNFVVLAPSVGANPTGSLFFIYFLRPNTLTSIDDAATCTSFIKTITIDNTTLISGDSLTLGNYFLEAGGSFAIGATSIITATNLVAAINMNGLFSASNGTVSSATVTISYADLSTEFSTTNTDAFDISTEQGVQFDNIPSDITNGSIVDFLQTQSGHRTKGMDVTVPSTGVSGTVINFDADDVPEDFIVGDYICPATFCIIPQIPTDLHSGLAERTAVRILAALGDQAGVAASEAKINQISNAEDKLLDSRVEGSPKKILNRHSLLRYGKNTPYRW